MAKRLRHIIWLCLVSMLCISIFVACEEEPEQTGSDVGLSKVYDTMKAEGLLTDDLLYLADVKVTFSATGTGSRTFDVESTSFLSMSRYEIERPQQPKIRVKVTAVPKQDFAQRLSTKNKWTLIDSDSYIKFSCIATTLQGKHIRTSSIDCDMQQQRNLTPEQVKDFFMKDQNWEFSCTYIWGSQQ